MKNILIIMLSFITIFVSNIRAYAFENEAKKQEIFYLQQQEKIVNTDLQPFMIADNTTIIKVGSPSILWIGSIFIMGLGQLLLGDFGRGLSFWLWFILGSVLLAITILGIVLIPVYFIILHIWSIIDAYSMANDLTFTRVKLSNSEKIKDTLNILEKFSVSDNSLKFQAISF